METLKDYTRIIVETDEENPATIATITDENVDVADGYRVRITPRCNSAETWETFEKRIEDQNNRIYGLTVNIAVSLIVSILVNIAIAKGLGLW